MAKVPWLDPVRSTLAGQPVRALDSTMEPVVHYLVLDG